MHVTLYQSHSLSAIIYLYSIRKVPTISSITPQLKTFYFMNPSVTKEEFSLLGVQWLPPSLIHIIHSQIHKYLNTSIMLTRDHTWSVFTYLASSRRGSKGGYIDRTTSSTREPIRRATETRSVRVSGNWSCCALLRVTLTSFSVSRWATFRIARQWGTRPLETNTKDAWKQTKEQ